MGQCCCCAPCCYFRGWPLHHYLHHRDFFFSFLRCWRICVDGCGDGEQKEKELGLGWEMRGDLAKWVTATGRADKRLTSTYANVRSRTRAVPRTHNKTETVLSCVPTASFPCKAPKIKPAQPAGSTEVLHFAPLLRTPGLEERHKALSLSTTRGRLLFYPICPAPWGGSLSHEYLVTQATLAIKSWRGFELGLSLKLVTARHRPILHLRLENHLQTLLIFSTGIKWKLTQTLL